MSKVAVVLFCDDFRIKDNPALFYASKEGYKIIPLFIYNEDYQGRKLGSASKVFLNCVLKSFSELLMQKYNQKLVIKSGSVVDILKEIRLECEFEKVFFNRSYSLKQIETEREIANNFNTQSFKAKLIFEPDEIREFKVFTPFWKECLKHQQLISEALPEPSNPNFLNISSLKLQELGLLPVQNWWQDLCRYWEFDYEKLNSVMANFFENKAIKYSEERNFLDKNTISKFSPYIRFGVFSVKELFLMSVDKFTSFNSEIGWREFAFHTLYRNQNLHNEELKKDFKKFRWNKNEDFLQKWQAGKTGESIVDAGMKELWKTGFMHGRARMITASFLVKDLMIDWKRGEEWFWDCLFDACIAVNPFSWQWVFGSGYDSAPYFRVFNPKLQQEKFDLQGLYVKKWNTNSLNFCITDHDTQRKEVLSRYKEIL